MPDDRPDRLSTAEQKKLSPYSLIGSFFLSDKERQWQGCVVAEPASGVYLVELFSWLDGTSTGQFLVPIGEMSLWAFFDSASWMIEKIPAQQARWEKDSHEADSERTLISQPELNQMLGLDIEDEKNLDVEEILKQEALRLEQRIKRWKRQQGKGD